MKIAIIGAGWYGCHLALSLLQAGYKVSIFEKSNSTITGASKKNQNRLHLGFHYPRNHETRLQSKSGFEWFIEHYGQLTNEIDNNIYSVPYNDSTVDFETYKIIMKGSGLEFKSLDENELEENGLLFSNMEGYLSCKERVVKNNIASDYFNDILGKHIKFNTYVDLSSNSVRGALEESFDYVIDCTWGASGLFDDVNYYYEPCIYFYYKNKTGKEFALTIMDGEFYSLYPYFNDIYTLTSVKNTPLGQYNELNEALISLNLAKNDKLLIREKQEIFESEFIKFYPGFLDDFEFVSSEFSMKTKILSSTDYRGCFVKKKGKFISVFSGKIDTLHIAEKAVHDNIRN